MNWKEITIVSLACASVTALAFSFPWMSVPLLPVGGTTVHTGRAAKFVEPPNATDQQRREALDAWLDNAAPPTGFTYIQSFGQIEVKKAREAPVVVDAETFHRHYVFLKDETADLDYAAVKIDGTVVDLANRANAKVTDANGIATATLEIRVPVSGTHTYRVEWVSQSNITLHSEIQI
jgi:hypothetical protein